ncbi:MAG: DUF488 family protein [Solirubrobacterales bacterium]
MAKPGDPEILTVGHSNHEERAFIELLKGAGVELIADVRANPRSRYPQFNRSALAASLEAAGIGYVHLGAELGGRRQPTPDTSNIGWQVEPFQGYADHMASSDFHAGLARLEELATRTKSASTKSAATKTTSTRSSATKPADGSTAAGYTATLCARQIGPAAIVACWPTPSPFAAGGSATSAPTACSHRTS